VSKTSWQLWREQIYAVARIDLKRNFLSRRALWVYLMALAPVAIFGVGTLVRLKTHSQSTLGMDTHSFAATFQIFYLRFVVFFGCAGVFLNLFHGEVLDKSLHFYFLAPLRREALLAGKYLSGLAAASVIFGLSVVLQFAALYSSYDSGTIEQFLFRSHGWEQLAAYLGVTILACAGYGSVFLFVGVLFRKALLPSIIVLVWETLSGYLPPTLQKVSVIYYLKSLCPVEVVTAATPHGGGGALSFFAFNPEPARVPTAILALLILSLALLVAASRRIRHMEIDYGTE
jgi:ABC-type transport system involved in multi-copper enzyme maturation permease subunit